MTSLSSVTFRLEPEERATLARLMAEQQAALERAGAIGVRVSATTVLRGLLREAGKPSGAAAVLKAPAPVLSPLEESVRARLEVAITGGRSLRAIGRAVGLDSSRLSVFRRGISLSPEVLDALADELAGVPR